jgi:hypothetical protein
VVEARLELILGPYHGRLESAAIYGIPTLRREGARAHDWFAFVKPGRRAATSGSTSCPSTLGQTSSGRSRRLSGSV